jgi:hypothetical protein
MQSEHDQRWSCKWKKLWLVKEMRQSKKKKHFTCLGLTLLNGDLLMCVVIVDAKKEDMLVKTGVDVSCKNINDTHLDHYDDFDYFMNNLGSGRQYPGRPICTNEGKEVPCMVEFCWKSNVYYDLQL